MYGNEEVRITSVFTDLEPMFDSSLKIVETPIPPPKRKYNTKKPKGRPTVWVHFSDLVNLYYLPIQGNVLATLYDFWCYTLCIYDPDKNEIYSCFAILDNHSKWVGPSAYDVWAVGHITEKQTTQFIINYLESVLTPPLKYCIKTGYRNKLILHTDRDGLFSMADGNLSQIVVDMIFLVNMLKCPKLLEGRHFTTVRRRASIAPYNTGCLKLTKKKWANISILLHFLKTPITPINL